VGEGGERARDQRGDRGVSAEQAAVAAAPRRGGDHGVVEPSVDEGARREQEGGVRAPREPRAAISDPERSEDDAEAKLYDDAANAGAGRGGRGGCGREPARQRTRERRRNRDEHAEREPVEEELVAHRGEPR